MAGRRFSENEIKLIKRLYASGETIFDIATQTERSHHSIKHMVLAQGFERDPSLYVNRLEAISRKGEIWKEIDNYPDYRVSSFGRVVSLTSQGRGTLILTHWIDPDGYHHVNLYKNSRNKRHAVHILVATAFIGPRPFEGAQVCHNDGYLSNCCKYNLRWDTCKNNHKDKVKHGTLLTGDRHPNSKYSEALVDKIRDDLKHSIPRKDIAEYYDIPLTFVHDVALGRRQ